MTDDSNQKYYFTVTKLDELNYTEETKNAVIPLKEVLDQAYQTIQLCLSAETRKIFFSKQKPSPIVQNRLDSFKADTFGLLTLNRPFLTDLLTPLFWLTHLQINQPDKAKIIKELKSHVGKAWGRFLFPFETNSSLSPTLRDSFVYSIPYFYTQCIQHLFILLLDGNPPTAFKPFRMKICASLVKIFTHVEPLESLLLINLGFYFKTSPQVDLNSSGEPEKQKFEEPPSSLLPEENLDTLIEMPRRKRPRSTFWNIAGISGLVSESTNRKSVPFEHNSKIVVQYPKDGEKDWTSELPPLLPDQTLSSTHYTKDNYDPNKETRSLLYRSRRPEIMVDYNKMKKDFELKVEMKKKEIKDKRNEFTILEAKIKKKPLIVLKKFTDDLRNLQLERKWNETPELHKKKELEQIEKERLIKLEKEKEEAELEKKMKKMKKKKKEISVEKTEDQTNKEEEKNNVPLMANPYDDASSDSS